MIGFYILLILGMIMFLLINIYSFAHNLLTSIPSTLIFELIFLWVCIGPQLILYYILKLKQSINSYKYLYGVYEDTKKQVDDLHLENALNRKEYDNKVEDLKNVPYQVIERQKLVIKELTKQRDRYKEEYVILKRKYLEENDGKDGRNT